MLQLNSDEARQASLDYNMGNSQFLSGRQYLSMVFTVISRRFLLLILLSGLSLQVGAREDSDSLSSENIQTRGQPANGIPPAYAFSTEPDVQRQQHEIEELNRYNQLQVTQHRMLWMGLLASVGLLGLTGMLLLRLRCSNRKLRSANIKLDQASSTLKATLDAVPDILFEFGRDGTCYDCHTPQTELLVQPIKELLGKQVRDVLPHQAAEMCLFALNEADEKGISTGKIYSLDLPQGLHWFEISVARKTMAPGEPPRFIMLSRDITERKQVEEELRRHRDHLEELIDERTSALKASEARLRESQQVLSEAKRIAQIGSWELNLVDNVLTWSDEVYRIFEMDPRQVGASDEAFTSRVHPDDRGAVGKAYAASLLDRRRYEIEHRLLFPDGRVKYVVECCENYYDENGTALRSQGTVQDITERKVLEFELAVREREFRSLAENLPVAVIRYDSDHRRSYLNPAAEKMLHGTADALLGQLIGAGGIPATSATLDRYRSKMEEVYATGEARELDFVLDALPEDAREHFEVRFVPEYSADQHVASVLAIWYDMTERKRLEAELRASRNFLDGVIDAVPDPIFVKDMQHRWILVNDANCKFFGLSREEMVGKTTHDVLPKEQADNLWKMNEVVFNSGEVCLAEERFTSNSGENHYIQTKKTPFISSDGQKMLVGVIRDITDRKHYEAAREAALAEAQRLATQRSEFIAHMSHELRTPLNGILGNAQLLGRDEKLDARQLASVKVIRQSGEHLLDLIEEILDLASIESGYFKFEYSDIPLHSFLMSVIGIVEFGAKEKKLDLIHRFAPDLPQGVHGDEKRLRQVLLNLLSNAVKFTDQGSVMLTVDRVTPSRLSFTVSDTGIGIDDEDHGKIFKSFEQVGSHHYRAGGTGLGLPISRQLVCLMGGDIEFESQLGKGSTFSFELELPEVNILPEMLMEQQAEIKETAEPILVPQRAVMEELHRLATLGNMRDIAHYAKEVAGSDSRLRPFMDRLIQLAEQFHSKAILTLVEEHLP